jgi:hypothetical protein
VPIPPKSPCNDRKKLLHTAFPSVSGSESSKTRAIWLRFAGAGSAGETARRSMPFFVQIVVAVFQANA